MNLTYRLTIKVILLIALSTLDGYWPKFSQQSSLLSSAGLQEWIPVTSQIFFWAILASLLSNLTHHFYDTWERQHPGITIPKLLKDLSSLIIWSSTTVVVLSKVFEIDVTALLTASGLMIAVIGFALRSMISDIFTGIALGIERPFRIGDWIQVDEYEPGKVVEMNWRSTKIKTEEQVMVVFSNSILATKPFQNYSSPQHYFRDSFTVPLDSSITVHKAERIFMSAISQVSETMRVKEKPEIRISGFSSRGTLWQILYWVGDYSQRYSIRHEIQRRMLRNMHYSGITIASERIEFEQAQSSRSENMDCPNDDLQFIRTLPLFGSLNESELGWLQHEMKRIFFRKGSHAVKVGDEGESLFIVQEGNFDISILNTEGNMVSVGHLILGTFFGEMSLLTGTPRHATITAEVDSIAYELGRDALTVLFNQRPEVLEELSSCLAERQLQNSDFLKTASETEVKTEMATLAQEFIGKIKRVFGFHKAHQEELRNKIH